MGELKVITEPKIYLVGYQHAPYSVPPGNAPGLGKYLADIGAEDWESDATTDGELLAETAGRVCYASFRTPRPGGNKAYLGHIIESGHGTILEHCVYSFIFTGISRSLTHELIRARVGMSYSQLSQRFVDESDVAFVCPPVILPGKANHDIRGRWTPEPGPMPGEPDHAYRCWLTACGHALEYYGELVRSLDATIGAATTGTARRKAIREAARAVLPNCTETAIFITTNARALRTFLEQRGSPGADAEIRRLAVALVEILREEAPAIFGDYETYTDDEGRECVRTKYPKV